ncbi:Pup--protein ligase [Corynebacterium freiburgense]|uniref:Pup--protein ligase n=1 Tax=Corynebacterium freiburgense TaxID=556548 RepID=UPI000417A6DF|nr:Pup--protein ligase [Corynebacterium freiburgense]WJZ02635.1 Pup--protein ligase [Corynebacterium freiburgense]
MVRRIAGVETEYGITCTFDGRRRLGPEEIARYVFRPIVDTYGSANVFLPNAGRLYLDVGSHPEYATPECDSIAQLLTYDKAGDQIVDQLAQQAEISLAQEGIAGQVFLFKNNVDSFGNSYGCHENYLVSRSTVLRTLGNVLLPFLITRQLLVGAGKIYRPLVRSEQDPFGLGYCISQRADHVWEGVSSATTRSRPIINTRDEPHADSRQYRRLHIIVGDSNMAEPTFALKIGSTLLVLELIEAGWPLPDFALENEIASIREIARDTTGNTPIRLRNGNQVSALEIQRAYCDAATQWLKQRPQRASGVLDSDLHRVVDLWDRVLRAIETQDFSAVDTEIDWVIKRKLLERFQHRHGFELDHPKLLQVDLAYHDVRQGRGLYSVLESKGLVQRWIDPAGITQAASGVAPQTTRAKLRGEFLSAAYDLQASVTVDWMRLKVNRPEPISVELGDPFATIDDRVDELIEYMKTQRGI